VARLIAHRLSKGQSACSAETGAYCLARKRLPEAFFADVMCRTGRALDANANSQWNWKGRRVLMFDGTTASMPDISWKTKITSFEASPLSFNRALSCFIANSTQGS
jgi:hypothetical protein